MPIALREPKEVRSSSMQTPHDPAVTYSGHKGCSLSRHCLGDAMGPCSPG